MGGKVYLSSRSRACPQGCHKLAASQSDWRIRVGDYRIVYEIVDAGKVVRVMKVGHRREVYQVKDA